MVIQNLPIIPFRCGFPSLKTSPTTLFPNHVTKRLYPKIHNCLHLSPNFSNGIVLASTQFEFTISKRKASRAIANPRHRVAAHFNASTNRNQHHPTNNPPTFVFLSHPHHSTTKPLTRERRKGTAPTHLISPSKTRHSIPSKPFEPQARSIRSSRPIISPKCHQNPSIHLVPQQAPPHQPKRGDQKAAQTNPSPIELPTAFTNRNPSLQTG